MTADPTRPANSFVGSPIERIEDLRFLRGRGQYVDDLSPAGLLHAVVVRSSVAHGRIHRIDSTAALARPGVHAVITAAEISNVPDHSAAAGAARDFQALRAAGDRRRQGALCRRTCRRRGGGCGGSRRGRCRGG